MGRQRVVALQASIIRTAEARWKCFLCEHKCCHRRENEKQNFQLLSPRSSCFSPNFCFCPHRNSQMNSFTLTKPWTILTHSSHDDVRKCVEKTTPTLCSGLALLLANTELATLLFHRPFSHFNIRFYIFMSVFLAVGNSVQQWSVTVRACNSV